MINLDILLDVSEIGGKEVNQDRKVHISDHESGKALLLVADGVGGSKQGEIAAQVIVDTAIALWEKRNEFDSAKIYLEKLSEEANNKIKDQIEKSIKTASTLSAVAIWPGECVSVHAGDSRIYQFNDSGFVKHSRDHSLAYSKFLMGEITEEELATHPTQTQLLSCVDGGDPSFEFTEWNFNSGDVLVVCTDGFWEVYSNDSLYDLIDNPDRNMLFINHFDRVLEERPKHDNTTAIISRVEFEQPSTIKSSAPRNETGVLSSTENSEQSESANSKTFILIALVIIVALAAIFMLSPNEEVKNTESEVNTVPSPSEKPKKADESSDSQKEETNKENTDSDSSDSHGKDAENNNPDNSDAPSSGKTKETNPDDDSEENPDGNSQSLPDLNDGLDSTEGLEIEIEPGKDIKQQLKDSLIKRDVISKESDVILGDAKTDQYSTVRDLQIKVNGIPVFGAQAKLIKTEKGFEIVTGKLANVQAPTEPPKKNFSQCLGEHADLSLSKKADPKGKLYLDAKTGGYLWMSIGVENASLAEFRILFYDADCKIKLKEPLLISQGSN